MARSVLSWRRTVKWLLVMISLAFLVNSFLVFVTIHGQQEYQEGSLHSLLRGGSKNYEDLWWMFHDGSPLVSSLLTNHITEHEYWHRMLQHDGHTTSDCNSSNMNKTISYTNHSATTTSTTISLSNSFQNDIRIHVQQHPNAPACLPPPTEPQCDETHYSVLLYYFTHETSSQVDDDDDDDSALLRPLVTRIMALLAYPTVQDIHLIVPNHVAARWNGGWHRKNQSTIGKYGQRIQQWEDQGKIHSYATTSTKTLWDVVTTLPNFIQTQSVLWLDAAPRKDWNGTMLKSQLVYWRLHPDVMTVQRFIGIRHSQEQQQVICHVPSMHGMMVHRHHLCLLSHPVVKMFVQQHSALWLKEVEEDERILATTLIMSLVLLHASPLTDVWYTLTARVDDNNDDDHTTIPEDKNKRPISHSVSSLLLEYFGCPCIPDTVITNNNNDGLLTNDGTCPEEFVEIVNQWIPNQPI
jgi:hypothetical protein